MLLCFGAVGAWTAERGRSLCAAATAQVEALTPAVEKTTAGLDAAAAEARILHRLRAGTLEPVRTAFPEQHAPTRVVRMRLPDDLRDRVENRYVAGGAKINKARFVDLDALAADEKKKKIGGKLHGGSGRKDKGVKNAKRMA